MLEAAGIQRERSMTRTKLRGLVTAGLAAMLALGLGLSSASPASTEIDMTPAYEEVNSIPMLRRPHSWQVIDNDTVVIWATPFEPYLIELAFSSPDLRFSQVIGVTQAGSRVYAKFDAVNIGGFRYPIDSIYKMTRGEARNLARGT
jgi:hypothetical protein